MNAEQLNVAKELTLAALEKLEYTKSAAGGSGEKYNEYVANEVTKLFMSISDAVVEASSK